jgi:exodeoxyribonuclease VII large subunit
MRQRVKAERQAVGAVAGRLHALSPLGVLERGYSIVLGPEGRAVTEAASLKPGDALDIRVAKGAVKARVDEVNA